MSFDLESVIEDSLTDSTLPEDPIQDAPEAPVEASPDPIQTDTPVEAAPTAVDDVSVASPAARAAQPVVEQDEFAKKYGIPSQTGGRENRIPYSRVKKIAERAASDASAAKTTELETNFNKQLGEVQAKVTDYEGRLQQVAQFEQLMATQPREFVSRLANIPAYREIFQAIAQMGQQQQQAPAAPPVDDMPQPDQQLEDGTMVYSLDGLKALNAWNRDQARKETLAAVESRYAPMEQEWQAHQHLQRLAPQVQAQIDSARKWPLFTESEPEITKVLADNPRISLEGAYNAVVVPKILAERDRLTAETSTMEQKVRAKVLAELKNAPAPTTSMPSRQSRPSQEPTGPQSLEDIIKRQIDAR